MGKFSRNALKLLRPIVNKLLPAFSPLKSQILQAKLDYTLPEYVAQSLLLSLLALLTIDTILIILLWKFNLLTPIYLFILIPISIFVLLTGMTISYFYPSIKISERKRKIENALYLATIYMSAISSSGTQPLTMFKILANMKEFDELSKECQEITYLTEILGVDLPTALSTVAEKSPSKEWKDLLYSIRTIIVEGGNLPALLYEKSKGYMEEYKRKVSEFTRTLSLLLEVYITLVIVGTVFVIVITSIAGAMTPIPSMVIKMIQLFVMVFGLPMASIFFIIMTKALSPFET